MYDADDLLGADPRIEFEQMLERRCTAGNSFALMLVDLEGFKAVSTEYGANVGNLLLYEVTSRIREKLGERDVVMHSGDNQFAIFAPGVERIESAEHVAQEIIDRLESAMTVAGTRFRLTASIGITLFPEHGDEWRTILHSADAAAYDARTQGRGRISISIPPPKPR